MEDHSQLGRVSDAVAAILAAADAEIASLKPVCRASGRCCKFEEYGHQLYVTGVELLHFHHTISPPIENPKSKIQNPPPSPGTVSLPQFFAQHEPRGCPYQIEGLCTAREARPLGCRIYFCDENAKSWQNPLYEKYHAQLKEVHARFGVPYRYVEWRQGLREHK